MDGPLIASASRVRLARVVRVGELCLIPLSNNFVALITWRTGLDLYPALAAALYLYIGARYLNARESRFHWSWRNAGIGTLAGLALALPATLFFVHPVVVSTVSYGLLAGLSVNGLLLRLLIDLPVLTVIFEELVFRYWLYFETMALPRTLLINASLFTTWHGVAAFTAVLATQLGTSARLLVPSYLGALASVFVAGIVFAWVRRRTGSFIYAALAHWWGDAAIILTIWALARLSP